MAESGYLLLTDITGYTGFMSDSELGHAKEIMESLINTIIEHLQAPWAPYKLEGDAVAAYSLDEGAMKGQSLLESVEQLYFAFHQELESSDRNTTCGCKACANMHNLDLKAVIHHGEFGLQNTKATNQVKLMGNDVIIAHRLLKNSIPEKTGVGAYAFFSEAATEQMHFSEFTSKMTQHSETYEQIGEVNGFVYDLKPAWARERERRRVFISHNEAVAVIEDAFDVPQSIAWDYLTAPESIKIYTKREKVTARDTKNGRVDTGTTFDCDDGKTVVKLFVVDWKPFSYFTIDLEFLPSYISRYTVHLIPETKTKTLVKFNVSAATSNKPLLNFYGSLFGKTRYKKMAKMGFRKNLDTIQEMIAKDKESGNMQMRMITAEPQPMD